MTQGESLPAIVPGALDPDLVSDPGNSDPGRTRSYDLPTDPTASWSSTDPGLGNDYSTGMSYPTSGPTSGNGYATGSYTNGNGYANGNGYSTGTYTNGNGTYTNGNGTNGHAYNAGSTGAYTNGNGHAGSTNGNGYAYTNGNGHHTGNGYGSASATDGNGYATGTYTNGSYTNGNGYSTGTYTNGNGHTNGYSYANGNGHATSTTNGNGYAYSNGTSTNGYTTGTTNGNGYSTGTYTNGNGTNGHAYSTGAYTNGNGYAGSSNPGVSNPGMSNPGISNPGVSNPGVTSSSVTMPASPPVPVTGPGASGQWTQAPGAGPQTGNWQTVAPSYQSAAPAQIRTAPAAAPVPSRAARNAAATITAEATTSPGMRSTRHKATPKIDPDMEIAELSPPGKHERPVENNRSSFVQKTVEAAHTAAMEDARLLTALRALVSAQSLYPRVLFLAAGFAAIGPLALSYIEFLPLPQGARYVLLPASLMTMLLCFLNRVWGRRAMTGYIAGIIATFVYDCVRWSLIPTGIWEDPIPDIGRQLLNDPDALWLWGYVWRFLGNGAGMGMAFAMLPWRGVKSGIIYGCLIATGLFVVLFFFPVSQTHFFPLTPFTFVGGYIGHIVYGGILGWIVSYLMPPPTDPAVRTQEFTAITAKA